MKYYEIEKVYNFQKERFKMFMLEKSYRVDYKQYGTWHAKTYFLKSIKRIYVYIDVVYFKNKPLTKHLKIKKSLLGL